MTQKLSDQVLESAYKNGEIDRLRRINADLLAALEKIQTIARPGQEMTVSIAVDAICDIWNEAKAAIAKAKGQQ